MSGASKQRGKQRGRQERIESLGIQKPRLVQWWENSDKAAVATRIGIAVLAALLLLAFCRTWQPTFAYRLGMIPARDLVTRATFEVPNELETNTLRDRVKREQLAFYSNRTEPLDQLVATLQNDLLLVLSAESFDAMEDDEREAFSHFYEISETNPAGEPNQYFSMLKSTFANDPELKDVGQCVEVCVARQLSNMG